MAFLGGLGASSRVRSLSNTKSCREEMREAVGLGQKQHQGRVPASGGAGREQRASQQPLTNLTNRSLIALGGATEEERRPGGSRRDGEKG